MLATRNSLITESQTSGMRNKAKYLKEQGIPVINMAAGELDIEPSDILKNATKQAIDKDFNKYTDTLGLLTLRKQIAELVTKATKVKYSAEEVGVTAGAKQALFNAAMVLFNPGDEVIIPSPYWVTFPAQVKLAGAVPVILETKHHQYQIDIPALKKLITPKTKAIIINSPNNPTGVIYSQRIMEEITDLAIKNNIWLIFDECYSSLVQAPAAHISPLHVNPAVKDRLILINSFSKSCSITGWRIGYMCAPKIVIDAAKNLQGHVSSNPSSIIQAGVLAVFDEHQIQYNKNVNDLLKERLTAAMSILDGITEVSYIKPEGAFYIFINIKNLLGRKYNEIPINNSTHLAELLLEHAQVAVVPGDAFGDGDGIRISYSLSKEDIIKGLTAIKTFISALI